MAHIFMLIFKFWGTCYFHFGAYTNHTPHRGHSPLPPSYAPDFI